VPVRVDNSNARSDKDAYEGHFVRVVEGDHAGAVGVFQSVEDYADDGYPDHIVVKFTDPAYDAELAVLHYNEVVPRDYKEGQGDPQEAEAAAQAVAEERYIEVDKPAQQLGQPPAPEPEK
jgi:hypothetical protein